MRLRTIGLISVLAVGLLADPLSAEAQQAGKMARIGYLPISEPFSRGRNRQIPLRIALIQPIDTGSSI